MFVDIVFPKGNEKDFLDMAEKLGIEGLCFVYGFTTRQEVEKIKEKISKLNAKPKVFIGLEAELKKIGNAKALSDIVIAKPGNDTRRVFEKSRPDIVYGLELSERKDFMHHRNSGLDQISCKAAAKNDVMVGFSFSSILAGKRDELFGRISQNIKLCKKYNVKTVFASFAESPEQMRASGDLKALFTILGMHTSQLKQSAENTNKKIIHNQKVRSGEIVGKGIRVVKGKS